uniref:Sec-independent protein translocase component TatC n=1 Tax=Hypnea spinella TaxID=105608 RepID=UPI003002EB2E|nr:Sec-independent protein translocase component TatC [Hypnea spinella]
MCCALCGYLISQHLSLIIFIESFFFIKLGFNQVVLINITDLFDLIWYICLKNSLFFSIVYFCHSTTCFFKPSWYFYQEFYRIKLFQNLLSVSVLALLVFYSFVLPSVLKFLTNWDINYFGDLLYIKFQLSLLHYIIWALCIKFCFIFIALFLYWFFIQFYFLVELKVFYTVLKSYKKLVFYVILCFLYFLSPPDVFLQIFILIINTILIEMFYFYICFFIQNIKIYKYANNSTTFKKIEEI